MTRLLALLTNPISSFVVLVAVAVGATLYARTVTSAEETLTRNAEPS